MRYLDPLATYDFRRAIEGRIGEMFPNMAKAIREELAAAATADHASKVEESLETRDQFIETLAAAQ